MPSSQFQLSHSGLCLCGTPDTTFGANGTWLSPKQSFAKARGIVETIKSEAAKAAIKIHHLRGDIAVLEGSGGNIAVLTGRDGKVLVDAGIAVSRPQVASALATLGPKPVTHLINTHWHFDHADGNAWLHELSPTIIAHENTRRHLSTTQRVEDWDFDFVPLPEAALPTELFATDLRLSLDGTTLGLRHYGPAHTDSDISVHFEEPDVLHVADTYWNGVYPFIDYSTGGSIDGSIRAADANLALATENTIVIPGHGFPVSDRAGLQRFRDMLVTVRDRVAGLKAEGRSLEEIVAARPTAAFDEVWGQFVITPALFTRLVHEGV
jgi:glyoxylase-like metal-dependent hydrolase (beta-lactamase superfamily II)